MTQEWKKIASLESLMLRQIEIKNARSALLEESYNNAVKIEQILEEASMSGYTAKLDENFEVVATLAVKDKKVFEKEQMADDLKVTPASTLRKDFLINMTEKKNLTLDKFNQYFSYHSEKQLSVKKKKIKQPKQKKEKA